MLYTEFSKATIQFLGFAVQKKKIIKKARLQVKKKKKARLVCNGIRPRSCELGIWIVRCFLSGSLVHCGENGVKKKKYIL